MSTTHTLLRRHRLRCAATATVSIIGLVALWSAQLDTNTARTTGVSGQLDGTGLFGRLAEPGQIGQIDVVALVATTSRWLSTALLGYLLMASMANLWSSLPALGRRVPVVTRWARRLAPRWLVMASVGLVAGSALSSSALSSTAGASTAGATAASATSDEDVVMEIVSNDPAPPSSTSTSAATTTTTTSTTLGPPPRIEPIAPRSDAISDPGPDQLPPPAHVERSDAPSPPTDQHVVLPGEHFWSIAVDVVADRGGDTEVGDYWRQLVAANRAGLVDPDNPDLIFPGQVLILP